MDLRKEKIEMTEYIIPYQDNGIGNMVNLKVVGVFWVIMLLLKIFDQDNEWGFFLMFSTLLLFFTLPFFISKEVDVEVIISFGGRSGPSQESWPVSTILVIDPWASRWSNLNVTLPNNWVNLDTVVVDNNIFLGGGNMQDDSNGFIAFDAMRFMKLNPATMEMTMLSNMKKSRNFVSLATLEGNIYALGGVNRQGQSLSSVEMYSISRNQWFMARSMNEVRSRAGAASLNGVIYVVGGFDGVTPLRTAEMFNPVTGKWRKIKPMGTARALAGVASMDGKVYVVGGWNGGNTCLSCGEMYNPETRRWTDLPDLNTPSFNHNLVVIQGRLVVLGGDTRSGRTNRVEMLNMVTNAWDMVMYLPNPVAGMSSCVLLFKMLKRDARDSFRWEKSELFTDYFFDADNSTTEDEVSENDESEDGKTSENDTSEDNSNEEDTSMYYE